MFIRFFCQKLDSIVSVLFADGGGLLAFVLKTVGHNELVDAHVKILELVEKFLDGQGPCLRGHLPSIKVILIWSLARHVN